MFICWDSTEMSQCCNYHDYVYFTVADRCVVLTAHDDYKALGCVSICASQTVISRRNLQASAKYSTDR